jgi:glycosyltransferase involved in cell wall biosynthesis
MRVAIFHDFFPFIGGGERLALTLARAWKATVYTTEFHPASVERLGFGDVRMVSLGSLIPLPPLKQMHASLRFAMARVDADAYVISGHWAIYAARHNHPNVLYCYTPARPFYDMRKTLPGRQRSPVHRAVASAWVNLHGAADRVAWTQVDRIVAVSERIRQRIHVQLGRDARVVYPPTDVSRFRFEALDDFWLSVNRLYPDKRLEIQFDAFRRLPKERLVVVGGYSHYPRDKAGEYVEQLRPPPNVELRGEVSESELIRLYARCRGLLCTARDEDFGMTPVEAMASGKVVLAVDDGGYRESVAPGETGFLLPPEPAAFASTISSLTTPDLERRVDGCRNRAMKFDVAHFLRGMEEALQEATS